MNLSLSSHAAVRRSRRCALVTSVALSASLVLNSAPAGAEETPAREERHELVLMLEPWGIQGGYGRLLSAKTSVSLVAGFGNGCLRRTLFAGAHFAKSRGSCASLDDSDTTHLYEMLSADLAVRQEVATHVFLDGGLHAGIGLHSGDRSDGKTAYFLGAAGGLSLGYRWGSIGSRVFAGRVSETTGFEVDELAVIWFPIHVRLAARL